MGLLEKLLREKYGPVLLGTKTEAVYVISCVMICGVGDSSYQGSTSNTQTYATLKHSVTLTLTLTPTSVARGGTYSVSGKLTDTTNSTNILSGMTISFITNSTLVTIPNTTTNATGYYQVTGLTAPNTAGHYSIQARYTGTPFYTQYTTSAKVLTVT